MKTSLKTLARAISPFTGAKSKRSDQLCDDNTNLENYNWDLTTVDMVTMLSNFYNAYNQDRVKSVNEILHQYEGEEILMLQQLCERYNLNQSDMQKFLDGATLGRKERFGNWLRKKSEGSVQFSDTGSYIEENNEKTRIDHGGYTWNLHGIDLAKALKLLYRTHNPQKTPNVASLENKSDSERILLLQQLCKRHNLRQSDMQQFLDKARLRENRSAIEQSSYSQGTNSGSGVALLDNFQQSDSFHQPTASEASKKAPSVIIAGLSHNNARPSLSGLPSSSSPPPPPPPKALSPTVTSAATLFTNNKGSPASELASVNSSVTTPSLVSDGLSSRSKLGAAVAARSASAASQRNRQRAPSPSPSVLTTSSIGSASVDRSKSKSAKYDARGDEGVSINSSSVKGSKISSHSVASSGCASRMRASELEGLHRELSEANQQVAVAQKENRALVKALQDSKQRQADTESTMSELSNQQQDADQVTALLVEVTKLKSDLKQQEEREFALKRQYMQSTERLTSLQAELASSQQQIVEARTDCRDVLRLVDIMSASPAGIKSVLEAYLKKLGDSTGSVSVKFGIGNDGRQIPISERISLALQIKREQQRHSLIETNKDKAHQEAETSSTGNNIRAHRNKELESKEHSAQQETYEQFKSKIAKVREHRSQRGGRHIQKQHRDTALLTEDESQDRHYLGSAQKSSQSSYLDDDGGTEEEETKRLHREDYSDYSSPHSAPSRVQENNHKSERTQASLASDIASDWIECMDPRSTRKYYYSAALKKSTWVRPSAFAAGNTQKSPQMPPSRYSSPAVSVSVNGESTASVGESNGLHPMTTAELGNSQQRNLSSPLLSSRPISTGTLASTQSNYDSLFASPTKSARQSAGQRGGSRSSSPATSLYSRSSQVRSKDHATAERPEWVVAVDPKSNKKYWYNRKTKVSTWRQPVELIV